MTNTCSTLIKNYLAVGQLLLKKILMLWHEYNYKRLKVAGSVPAGEMPGHLVSNSAKSDTATSCGDF